MLVATTVRSLCGAAARAPPVAGRRRQRPPLPTHPPRLPPPRCLQVLRLQHKLGELHSGDYNALRRAYDALCQHVSALEEEAHGMVGQLGDFETAAVPPELVAKEVGGMGQGGGGVRGGQCSRRPAHQG